MQPADYGPFPYVPITERPRLTWPNGAQIAVWVIPNLEFFPLTRGLSGHPFEAKGKPPTVRPWAQRDYGNRVGIWRIMDVLSRLGIRATASLNADICLHHPQIVRAGVDLGWEFIGHNLTNTVRLTELDEAAERDTIARSARMIAEATGRRPIGWLGAGLAETWHTLDLLLDEDFRYVADWTNDDQPYLMNVGGRQLVSMPYSYEVNDSPFLYYRNGTIDEFEKLIRRQFEVLYEEGAVSGRVMAICLHPFIIGVPHRIRGLESALKFIASHDKVWFATGGEIMQHYLASGATF
jgi:peptidoglycan/xylan/chitin deacetylase (PgdA/CDA1 family)